MTAIPSDNHIRAMPDGAAKQDCETAAAKRWLARFGAACAGLRPVFPGDDLFARQPMCVTVQAAGDRFLFVCKPSNHKTLSEYLNGVEPDSLTETCGRGAEKRIRHHRWMTDVPLRDGDDALRVNWPEVEIRKPNAAKPSCRCSSITACHLFLSWRSLLRTVTTGVPPPLPP